MKGNYFKCCKEKSRKKAHGDKVTVDSTYPEYKHFCIAAVGTNNCVNDVNGVMLNGVLNYW